MVLNTENSDDRRVRSCWIIGCGDIGKRLAALLPIQHSAQPRTNACAIKAIVSSAGSLVQCQSHNIEAYALDLDSDYTLNNFEFGQTDVFYFVPPAPTGKQDQRLASFLQKLDCATPHRIVLISTTGVYGDSAGKWIDENTPVNPETDKAFRRLSAEQMLQAWSEKTGCDYMILRVPGIYAQDRLPLEYLRKGLPVISEEESGFTNRIHADDLAHICKAAMESSVSNEIINVTDGNPSTMTDYFNQVADFYGLPRPPQIRLKEAEGVISAGMLSYMKASRRIKNDKILALLKIKLIYPDLKSALQH